MKKLLAIVLVLVMVSGFATAFAADQPFVTGTDYTVKYREHGSVPSMLNFGDTARLAPGENLFDVKTHTITKIKAEKWLKDFPDKTYYCYAKWQSGQTISDYTINAMLVLTVPSGEYYATYDSWYILNATGRRHYMWFFDVTDTLQRYLDEHNGAFATGEYTFSMFFNDMAFRVTKIKVS